MSELQSNIKEAVEKFDELRERLEFTGQTKELAILDDAMDALNRYLAVVEKFDRTKK
jgi:hypothetical protein